MSVKNLLPLIDELPDFTAVTPAVLAIAVDHVLEHNRGQLKKMAALKATPATWEAFVVPLDDMHAAVEMLRSTIEHLNAVCSAPEMRAAHEEALSKFSIYFSELGQSKYLYNGYLSLLNGEEYTRYDTVRRTVVDNALRNFKLAGAHLSLDKQHRYRELQLELDQLSSKFSNNQLDSTNAWSRIIEDESELEGLADTDKAYLAQGAAELGRTGWLVTLQGPCVQLILTKASNRLLRQDVYFHNSIRASELCKSPELDNGPIMSRILACRTELARLVGYENYAEMSLATKMAGSPIEVTEFLRAIGQQSRPAAQVELSKLRVFAGEEGVEDMSPWDIAYFSELYQKKYFAVSQDLIRTYFQVDHVLQSMFDLVDKLYDIKVVEIQDFKGWRKDVRLFEIHNHHGRVGRFMVDLYARATKRAGAWMDGYQGRHRDASGSVKTPIAYLVCNFRPAANGGASLLTHSDVITLFHEFGHVLHHTMTTIDCLSVSGINGVSWDAVELPSQFMENWCWQPEMLKQLGRHFESGEQLPDDMVLAIEGSRKFHSGLATLRQVEFALFDIELHSTSSPVDVTAFMEAIRDKVSLVIPPHYNRFANTFAHIFAGGYAAGYYSYKWAEVLAADAFSRFLEEGLFDKKVGYEFKSTILSLGGSQPAMELFKRFRGREPSINALLSLSGLLTALEVELA